MPPDDEGGAPEGRALTEAERGEVIVGMLGTALLVPGVPERVAAAVLAALGGPVVQGDDGAVRGAAAQAAISTGQEPPDPDEPDRLVAEDGAVDGAHDEDLPATGVWVESEEEDAGPPTAAMPEPAAEDDSGGYDLLASFPEPEPGSGRRRHRASSAPAARSASVGSPATGPGGGASAGGAINTLPSSAVAEALATAMVRDARPVLALLRLSTGQDVLIRAGGEVVIGRAPRSTSARAALVVVPSTSHMVSRSHMRITTAGSSVLAQDLGSSNGTTLHRPGCPAVLIASALPTPLSVGDVLSIGDGMTLRLVAPSAPMGAGPPSPPALTPPAAAPSADQAQIPPGLLAQMPPQGQGLPAPPLVSSSSPAPWAPSQPSSPSIPPFQHYQP
ncbi:FHA domain-containing protein [Actinomyces timonensis]|uniref:FHA domain-containing protein n=1 Tax=Actinomyces timonensis TaxID=1288391 RepID=A0AAU8N4D2_9ACTO